MIQTTTPNIEGKTITDYLGVVAGESILGASMLKDLFASLRDMVGGKPVDYEQELQKARDAALAEMADHAARLGADAIVGIDVDYVTVGDSGMLMIAVSGTAVRTR